MKDYLTIEDKNKIIVHKALNEEEILEVGEMRIKMSKLVIVKLKD